MSEAQFLGVPDVNAWLFLGLAAAALVTSFMGAVAGTAGGLALLAILALFFTPAVMVPVHAVVQLGASLSRIAIMWRYVMRDILLPFFIGSALGAALGGKLFISLPSGIILGAIGCMIIILVWLPKLSRLGGAKWRFAFIGGGATFLGVFVGAVGTLIAPFVAGASPDRRIHAATLAAVMTMVHINKLIAFGLVGVSLTAYTPLLVAMIAMTALGNWVAIKVLDRMPESLFRIFFKTLITLLGIRLLWVSASELGLV
ncbi:MAG: sulfite exporter TauE/SafE family protein [Rhodospirillales bacterium]|jgi:uncharacterized membrane protein YfcA|nr:sulfite exporter TauE/SafE family protein [Rhodospirillales bacterium]